MPSRPIILDTDPGGDDSVALFWLAALQRRNLVHILAVTTTDGNVSAAQTFRNASQILSLLGFSDVPLGKGAAVNDDAVSDASYIHGSDGLGELSATLPPPVHDGAAAPSSVDILIQALHTHPHEITLIAIGPLTNLASAEIQHPGILKLAKEIIVMGGAFEHPGNVTPHAEFNSWFNPIAAQQVFHSQANCTVLSLDVTHRLIFTQEMARSLTQDFPDHPAAQVFQQLSDFLIRTALAYRETRNCPGFLVHDAAAIAYAVYPSLFTFRRAAIDVETHGRYTRGQTICDRRLTAQPFANAWISCDVDCERFFTALLGDLHQGFQDYTVHRNPR